MMKGFIFERFKGYDKAVLWLEQVTTLIGTNASGKSNAIEGIQILSELAIGRELHLIFEGSGNLESNIRGGAKGCCRFSANSFTLGCIADWDETHDLLYRVQIGVDSRVTIRSEELYLVKNGSVDAKNAAMIFKTLAPDDAGNITVEYANGEKGAKAQFKVLSEMSVLSQIQGKLPVGFDAYDAVIRKARTVREGLSNIFILDPTPANMRGYSRIGDAKLRRNCANVSAVLYALWKKKDETWSQFEQIVRELPENEIAEITFVTTTVNDVILVQREKNGNAVVNMDAARLSDGTLRCIAALTAVMSEPIGSIVVMEELDNGIHPSRAKKLMNALSEIAKQRDIDLIVTTHNVTLLNGLSKEHICGVSVMYRDEKSKASRIIPFLDIRNQNGILAAGGVGDALESQAILKAIKDAGAFAPFAF